MKLEDVRYKMKVIVTKGFYAGFCGSVFTQPDLTGRVFVLLTTRGKNPLSRLWNSFSAIEKNFHIDEIEPL